MVRRSFASWATTRWARETFSAEAGGGQVARGVTEYVMRQLLLLRHAKSSSGDASIADRERPLNSRGRRTAGVMREAMRDLGLAPDIVLVSTARRTMQTLEALEPWDDTPLIEPMDSLYL